MPSPSRRHSPRRKSGRSRSRSKSNPRHRSKSRSRSRHRSRSPHRKDRKPNSSSDRRSPRRRSRSPVTKARPHSTTGSSSRRPRSHSPARKNAPTDRFTQGQRDRGHPARDHRRRSRSREKLVSQRPRDSKPVSSRLGDRSRSPRRDSQRLAPAEGVQSRLYKLSGTNADVSQSYLAPPSGQPYNDPLPVTQSSWSPESERQESKLYEELYGGSHRTPSPKRKGGPTGNLFPVANMPVGIPDLTIIQPSGYIVSLCERFGELDEDFHGNMEFEENITIGIHRKGPNMKHDPSQPVKRSFRQGDILTLHRKGEGKKRIFDREEIRVFRHDDILDDEIYEEKRTISVLDSGHKYESLQVDRRVIQDSNRRDSRNVVATQQVVKFNNRTDPRYEHLMRNKEDNREKVRIDRVERNPNDLRHSLKKRRTDSEGDDRGGGRERFDARRKLDARRTTGRDNIQSRSIDSRLGRRDDRRRSESDRRRSRSTERRNNSERTKKEEVLPDFKRREDRFSVEEWKIKPEMIPKNPMYYEHDVREDDEFYGRRGRGRPFRSRGGFRGSFRGRSNYRGQSFNRDSNRDRKSGGGAWKHDMFEREQEEKDKVQEEPSSTT